MSPQGIGSYIVNHLCEHCHTMVRTHVRTGRLIYIPKGRATADVLKIKMLRKSGATITKIASRFGLSERRIYQILQAAPTIKRSPEYPKTVSGV